MFIRRSISLVQPSLSKQIQPCNCKLFSTFNKIQSHENPLGLPKVGTPPSMSRGLPKKRKIPGCKRVLVIASGKGGVGKSSIAVNLALSLSRLEKEGKKLKIGLLDLDIFGPSIPKLMGLDNMGEPLLTPQNRLIPLKSHGINCMSMAFLLPPTINLTTNEDTPIVWRGMMVMKATQQLLFDVDWKSTSSSFSSSTGEGQDEDLDVLVIDTPPGTGDVALSLGQLVEVDGAVIVSTPQEVAILDTRKGIAMFKKIGIPIIGTILNMSYFLSPPIPPFTISTKNYIFGSSNSFKKTCSDLNLEILGEIPMEPKVSERGDKGWPIVLGDGNENEGGRDGGGGAREAFLRLGRDIWKRIE